MIEVGSAVKISVGIEKYINPDKIKNSSNFMGIMVWNWYKDGLILKVDSIKVENGVIFYNFIGVELTADCLEEV